MQNFRQIIIFAKNALAFWMSHPTSVDSFKSGTIKNLDEILYEMDAADRINAWYDYKKYK